MGLFGVDDPATLEAVEFDFTSMHRVYTADIAYQERRTSHRGAVPSGEQLLTQSSVSGVESLWTVESLWRWDANGGAPNGDRTCPA